MPSGDLHKVVRNRSGRCVYFDREIVMHLPVPFSARLVNLHIVTFSSLWWYYELKVVSTLVSISTKIKVQRSAEKQTSWIYFLVIIWTQGYYYHSFNINRVRGPQSWEASGPTREINLYVSFCLFGDLEYAFWMPKSVHSV